MRHSAVDRLPGYGPLPLLVVYVVILTATPSELVIGPLGAAGTPAGIIGLGFLVWWTASVVANSPSTRKGSAPKWLLGTFATALLLSYLAGMSRPLSTATEVNSSDRAMLVLCGWCGVTLLVTDGISSREQLDRLLRILSVAASLIALLGMLQFFFGLDIARLIRIPGLTANHQFGGLIERSTFRRVSGTTSHPIEFGVVLSSVLPIAVHYARFATSRASAYRFWAAVALIAGALPLSVARSGMLGGAIALAIMFFTWPAPLRRRVLLAVAAGGAVMSVVVPGLLGTIRGLFTNAASDPSTGGRTADYAPSFAYFSQAPLFGRGYGTFIPDVYRTLDNQYLGLLVEGGIVVVVATLALFGGSIAVARRVRRKVSGEEERDLAQSLVAAMAVIAVNAATFDLFGFAMCASLLFLLIGCVGAMDALYSPDDAIPVRPLTAPVIAALIVAVLGVTSTAAVLTKRAPPQYQALGAVLLVAPEAKGGPPLASAGPASMTASLIHDVLDSSGVREHLMAEGVDDFDVAVGDGSLMTGTDRIGTGGPVLRMITRSPSEERANSALTTVLAELRTQLTVLQDHIGVPPAERIRAEDLAVNPAFAVRGRPTRGLAASAILGLLVLCFLTHALRRRPPGLLRLASPAARRHKAVTA